MQLLVWEANCELIFSLASRSYKLMLICTDSISSRLNSLFLLVFISGSFSFKELRTSAVSRLLSYYRMRILLLISFVIYCFSICNSLILPYNADIFFMKFYEATARWAFLSSSVLVVRYLELFSYLSLLLLLSFKSFSLLLLRLFKQRFVSFSSRRVLASLLEVVI
jgi:hypothetical protein